jgi:hypothetical protein
MTPSLPHSYAVGIVIEIEASIQRKTFDTGIGCLLAISRPANSRRPTVWDGNTY